MRLFYALKPSEEATDRIMCWMKPLMEKHLRLKWVAPLNMHITLRFLGERCPEEVMCALPEAELVSCLPVEYCIQRSGTFGRPPSVLWLSGSFSQSIHRIAGLLADAYEEDPLRCEHRFTPHLTVARAGRGAAVPNAPFDGSVSGSFDTVLLMESSLGPAGPQYRVVRSFC